MGQIGNDVEYDELRRQHRDALRTIAEQSARIAALESALAEWEERERNFGEASTETFARWLASESEEE